ncbi:MAG: hypothetical protein AAF639_24145 [Chloroflexota bacterium]
MNNERKRRLSKMAYDSRRILGMLLLALSIWGGLSVFTVNTVHASATMRNAIDLAHTAGSHASTDIDLITNIDSDKMTVIDVGTYVFTATVENRGPATALNAHWLLEWGNGQVITTTIAPSCSSTAGAVCPATFPTTFDGLGGTISTTIPSMPADSTMTLVWEIEIAGICGEGCLPGDGIYRAISTVTPNAQTDAIPESNLADINYGVTGGAYSYDIAESVLRYENSIGGTVGTPVSGGSIVYQVILTNDGIEDMTDVGFSVVSGADEGNGTAIVYNPSFSSPGGNGKDEYAPGTLPTNITCVGATNGAICPTNGLVASTYNPMYGNSNRDGFLPGRTRAAAADPGGNPASTLTFEYRVAIGDITCSSDAAHYRTILNEVSLYGPAETPLALPDADGVSSDNEVELPVNVTTPVCPAYDILVQIDEPAAQSTGGVDEMTTYVYTVTVTNNGTDTALDLPFRFGLHHTHQYLNPTYLSPQTSQWDNFFTVNSSVSCIQTSGTPTCPASYTVQAQEVLTASLNSIEYEFSNRMSLPDLSAVIPSLAGGETLTFIITGDAGQLNICGEPYYFDVYADAVPVNPLEETLIEISAYTWQAYFDHLSGPGAYYGNNGDYIQTQWDTGTGGCPAGETFDVSVLGTGPFPDAASTTPMAGPHNPGDLIYFRIRGSNLDDIGGDVDFLNPTTLANDGLYLTIRHQMYFAFPRFEFDYSVPYGYLEGVPNLNDPNDPLSGTDNLGVPWSAVQGAGMQCLGTTGAALCPVTTDEVSFNVNGNDWDRYRGSFLTYPSRDSLTSNAIGGFTDYGDQSLHMPEDSSIEILLPYRIPPLDSNEPCTPGGGLQDVTLISDITPAMPEEVKHLYNNRNAVNDRDRLEFQVAIPDCAVALDIEKRTIIPANGDPIPRDGILRYEVDLIYPTAATGALDVARFTDIPSSSTSNVELINVVSCTVIAGNAQCPANIPIGQMLMQDGSLTSITAGTIDARWGTPGAANVAGGAAFEPGSTVRVVLEAQAIGNLKGDVDVDNDATFGSDPDSSIVGAVLLAEADVSDSSSTNNQFVLQQKVGPTDAAQGELLTFTIDVMNNGINDATSSYITNTVPAALLANNPAGFTNIVCTPLTTVPPLLPFPSIADCANVTITNNGAGGYQIDMTGSWPAYSGYQFTFNANAPAAGTSFDNEAYLVGPDPLVVNFGLNQISTVNVRTPDFTISGNVYHDTDRLTDFMVDGTGINNPDGQQIYAYLVVDSSDLISQVVAVDANGQFTFTGLSGGIGYDVIISIDSANVGDSEPSVNLPGDWVLVGEYDPQEDDIDYSPGGNVDLDPLTADVTNVDFGIDDGGLTTYSVSGTVYHDMDRLTDNMVDGTGINAPDGQQIYAYLLIDSTDVVTRTMPINPDGTYSFTGLPSGISYDVAISTQMLNFGDTLLSDTDPPTAFVNLPTGWFLTGELDGQENSLDTSPEGNVDLSVLINDVVNVDFGIDEYFEATLCPAGYDGVAFAWDDGTGAGYDWPSGSTSMMYTLNFTDSLGLSRSIDATLTLSDPHNRNADADVRNPHPYDDNDSCNDDGDMGEYGLVGTLNDPWDSDCNQPDTQTNGDFGDGYLTMRMLSVDHLETMTFTMNFSEPALVANFLVSDIDANGLLEESDNFERPGDSYQDELVFTAMDTGGSSVPLTIHAGGSTIIDGQSVRSSYILTDDISLSPEAGEGSILVSATDLVSSFSWAYSNGEDDAAAEQANAGTYSWWSGANGATNGVSDDHAVRVSGFTICVPPASVAVEKIRNTPDPVFPGAAITFTVRITNTGTSTITTLPLTDTYSTAYLTYVGLRTTPESDSTANNGQIVWSDLTQAVPNGFGIDLGPGDVFDVVVEFVAALDTTSLPNSWTVNTAQVYTHTVTDTVRIFAPTNVVLSSRDVAMTNDGVQLSWSTVDETELIGFHVMTIDAQSGEYMMLTDETEMIMAQQAGLSAGADYTHAINAQISGETHYVLALVMADGTQQMMDMGVPAQAMWTVYLPVLRHRNHVMASSMTDDAHSQMESGTVRQAPSVWMIYLPVLRK